MKKILIVDDEPAILTLLQYNLEAEHYQVETATDGQEALDKVRSEPFDFIILDLMLPSLSGLDVTRKIREEKIQTPIMILTAKDNETDKIVGLELGADDYVTKPFSPRELLPELKPSNGVVKVNHKRHFPVMPIKLRLVKLRLILKIIKLAKPDTDCN